MQSKLFFQYVLLYFNYILYNRLRHNVSYYTPYYSRTYTTIYLIVYICTYILV